MILATAGGVLLAALDILVRAVRLRALLGGTPPAEVGPAVAVNALGDAASALTPARLGGEPARFLALRARGTPAPAAVVVLAAERVVDMGLAALVTVMILALLGSRGFGDVADFARRFTSPGALPWAIAVAALVAVFAAVAWRLRARLPRVGSALREAVAHARQVAGWRLLAAVGLTLVSMGARVTVLPLLLWGGHAAGDSTAVFVGSFALIYAQLLLPTPAGAGAVDLGFVLGLARSADAGTVASLLVAWRAITLGIPAGLGGLVFLWNRGRSLTTGRNAAP